MITATDLSGLVVVDKPPGLTSHDVVARIRRLAGTRKVGHAGTLDPMATGVLLVGLNRATRLLGHLMLTRKAYDATVRLGESTTTDDAEGETLARTPTRHVDEGAVKAALGAFVGDIVQVPAAVSAIKVDGQRAYRRVRDGEHVELAARPVHVDRLELTGYRREGDAVDADVSVTCSSGTYVRAIARDLGASLGVGGHLTALRRTSVGPFSLDEAHTLDSLADDLQLVGFDDLASRCFPTCELDDRLAGEVRFGRGLDVDLGSAGPVAVLGPDRRFLALYEQRGALARPVAVFCGEG